MQTCFNYLRFCEKTKKMALPRWTADLTYQVQTWKLTWGQNYRRTIQPSSSHSTKMGFYFGMTEDIGEHRKSVRPDNLLNYWLLAFPSILAFNELTNNFPWLNQSYFVFIWFLHLILWRWHFFQTSYLLSARVSRDMFWPIAREQGFSIAWTVSFVHVGLCIFTFSINLILFFRRFSGVV